MVGQTRYYTPDTLAEALTILSQKKGARLLAGGTDLLVRHYEEVENIPHIIDISRIAVLKEFETGDKIVLGSLTSHHRLAVDFCLRKIVPFLATAASEIGGPQIRHRGTLGGNLVNASPAADTAPPLIVLGALVCIAGVNKKRKVPLSGFFKGPGETVLGQDEILVKIEFDKPRKNQVGSYVKIGQRKALAIGVASIAVFVTIDDNREIIKDISICAGSVAPVPLLLPLTADILRGTPLNELPLQKAKKAIAQEVRPIDDIRASAWYRRNLCGTILIRALEQSLKCMGVELNGGV